jgi:hypothetical protein
MELFITWDVQKNPIFIKAIVQCLNIKEYWFKCIYIAIINFSTSSSVVSYLNIIFDKNQLIDTIYSIRSRYSGETLENFVN